MKRNILVFGILLLAGSILLTGCGYSGPPVYGVKGGRVWETITASDDDEYGKGDLVVVTGDYNKGGTPGGAVRVLDISVPKPNEDDSFLLDGHCILERAFYLDNDEGGLVNGDQIRVTGMVVEEDLYAYGYRLDNSASETVTPPQIDEAIVRADLEIMVPLAKGLDLDDITGKFHKEMNKGYEITANPAAAKISFVGRDYDNELSIYKAFLEQLPPYNDPRWYRSLDVYMIYDDDGNLKFSLVTVGGYFLE